MAKIFWTRSVSDRGPRNLQHRAQVIEILGVLGILSPLAQEAEGAFPPRDIVVARHHERRRKNPNPFDEQMCRLKFAVARALGEVT
ncbi:MAG: hypothetical protein K0S19_1110 [Geminicoccaceae bacterium]|nr:hypothetical protein [Geminicoccaceae bacterium]